MTIHIYDNAILQARGALVDFAALHRQSFAARFAVNERKQRSLFLRWQTSAAVGLPTEPFKVWQRPAFPVGLPNPVAFEQVNVTGFLDFARDTVLQFAEPLASVTITVSSAAGGPVFVAALIGPPTWEAVIGFEARTLVAGGDARLTLQASQMTGLLLRGIDSFDPPTGLTKAELDKVDGWTLVETVGLPVDEGEWATLGQQHGIKQGLVGAELPARDAAVQRFARGVNPFGWQPTLPSGVPAPLWEMPDPAQLVKEAEIELLPLLRQVAAAAPQDQAAKTFGFAIPPPQNAAGG